MAIFKLFWVFSACAAWLVRNRLLTFTMLRELINLQEKWVSWLPSICPSRQKYCDLCSSYEFWLSCQATVLHILKAFKNCSNYKFYVINTSNTLFSQRMNLRLKRRSYILRFGIWDLKLRGGRPIFLAVVFWGKTAKTWRKYPYLGALAIECPLWDSLYLGNFHPTWKTQPSSAILIGYFQSCVFSHIWYLTASIVTFQGSSFYGIDIVLKNFWPVIFFPSSLSSLPPSHPLFLSVSLPRPSPLSFLSLFPNAYGSVWKGSFCEH